MGKRDLLRSFMDLGRRPARVFSKEMAKSGESESKIDRRKFLKIGLLASTLFIAGRYLGKPKTAWEKRTDEDWDKIQKMAKKEGLDPQFSYIYDNPRVDNFLIENRETILESAKKHKVDPRFVAGVISLEIATEDVYTLGVAISTFARKKGWNLDKESIPKIIREMTISEGTADTVKGLVFGDASVGPGQVWMVTVRKYNLGGAASMGNAELVYKLKDPEFNIDCVAQYTKIIEGDLWKDHPEIASEIKDGVYSPNVLAYLGEYYNGGIWQPFLWGPGVKTSVRYIEKKGLLTDNPQKENLFELDH